MLRAASPTPPTCAMGQAAAPLAPGLCAAQVIKSPGETVGLGMLQLLPVLCKQMIIES